MHYSLPFPQQSGRRQPNTVHLRASLRCTGDLSFSCASEHPVCALYLQCDHRPCRSRHRIGRQPGVSWVYWSLYI
jgi:hypothetical protein